MIALDEQQLEPPRRLRDITIAERYGISKRLAGEWLRRMLADDVVAKIDGRFIFGRLSACDGWVANGGQPRRRSRGGRP